MSKIKIWVAILLRNRKYVDVRIDVYIYIYITISGNDHTTLETP